MSALQRYTVTNNLLQDRHSTVSAQTSAAYNNIEMTTLDSGDLLSCFGRPVFNITAIASPVCSLAANLSSVSSPRYFMKDFGKIIYSSTFTMQTSFPLCLLISADTVL